MVKNCIMKHHALSIIMVSLIQLIFVSITVFGHSVISKCNRTAELEAGAIILAKPSIDAGAEFLDKVLVRSLRDCYTACCKLTNCNIGVFKSKPPAYCFLFNCTPTSRCSYTSQVDYYVITLTTVHSPSADREQSSNPNNLLDPFQSPTIGLDEICSEQHPCSTDHSFCSKGLCVCRNGWVRNGVSCVPFECPSPELQFRCNDSTTCVAIYDRCNGVIECPDGSDESNCPVDLVSRGRSGLNGNRSQLDSSSVLNTKSSRLSFLLNASSRERDQDQTDASVSQRMVDTDDLLNLPYMSSSHYQLRPGHFHGVHPLPIHQRSKLTERENYPNRRSVLTPVSTGTDWYLSDTDWEAPGFDQFSDYYPHYSASHTPVDRRLSVYNRDSHSRYDRDIFRRKTHKPWTSSDYFGSSMSPRSDTYDSLPTDAALRSYPRVMVREELVDPSVFPDASSAAVWDQSDRSHRTGHAAPGRKKSLSEKAHAAASSQEISEHPEAKTGTSSTASPTANSASHPDEVLSLLERNQSEGHTAALILAFSLGLVCCFIALLVFECRRRRHAHGLSARRRPNNVSVLFGDRRKLPVPGSMSGIRRNSKRTKSFRDPGGYVAVETDPDDDEDKLVQNGLVL